MSIGFLHIGKTGGTAFKAAIADRSEIKLFHHDATLAGAIADNPNIRMIFFVRDPLTRFVSAFYSRQRKGWPRYNSPWSNAEEHAFTTFKTATDLAEALTDKCPLYGEAKDAVGAIGHLREPISRYLGTCAELDMLRDNILFIGRQETLDVDFARLREMLNLSASVKLPTDIVGSHRAVHKPERLSPLAKRNIRRWYLDDYDLIDWCVRWRAAHGIRRTWRYPSLSSRSFRASTLLRLHWY